MADDEQRVDAPADGARVADPAGRLPSPAPTSWTPPPAPGQAPVAPPPAPAPTPAAPAPVAPSVAPPVPGTPAPGGVFAATGDPVPPPAPARRRGLLGVAGAGLVAVIALFLKFGLPILTATAVSGVLDGVFGGPFEKLPGDQQAALEQRFEAAMGSSLEGLSDDQAGAMIDEVLNGGLPRLGDALLIERMRLVDRLVGASDDQTCARLARAAASGVTDEDAMTAALNALDAASIGRWFEINISAIEAGMAGVPVRVADAAASDWIGTGVVASLDTSDAVLIGDLFGGGQLADAEACRALRALYGGMAALPDADLAVMGLVDVSP